MTRAPSAVRVAGRVLSHIGMIMLSASAIIAALVLWLGPPAVGREYHVKNEVARFAPTVGHGLLQFGGEALLLAFVAYASRRWLRVRL